MHAPAPGLASNQTSKTEKAGLFIQDKFFSFLPAGGECGKLLRSVDWSQTAVGPVQSWPQSLRIALGLMLDNKFGMYVAWGKEFTQFYNDGYRPILGSTKHPAAMGNTADQTFDESWQVIEPMFQKVMHGESIGSEDWLLPLNRHGYLEDCYFTFSYSPIRDENGNIGGVLVTVSETTERVKREKETLDVLESMDEAFFSVDKNWTILQINSKHEKATQKKREDQLGKSLLELFFSDPSHRESKYWINYHKAMDERIPIHFEDYYEPLDLWTSVNVYPKADGGLAVFFHDTTKTKKIESAIRESETQFRTLANSIPQLAWMANRDGYIHWYNQNWYSYTGTTPEQMEGWGWQSVHDPKELPKVMERWISAINSGEPFDMEFPIKGRDGTYRWFLTRAIPIKDAKGKVVRWIGANTDIDEQKRTIAKLETERSLREQFVSTLTHDLRSPLTAAKMSAQMIARSLNVPERIPSLTGRVIDNLDRTNQMIENLLDANRIKAGELLQLEMHETNLVALVSETLNNLTTSLGDRFAIEASDPAIKGFWSPDSLRRVVENLCTNAVKYSLEQSQVKVRVFQDSRCAFLSVHNAGNPIPPNELETLFDPFKRATDTVAKRGWGLGLTLVKGIAEAHGGSVTVQSGADEGTTFTVQLPLDLHPKSPESLSSLSVAKDLG